MSRWGAVRGALHQGDCRREDSSAAAIATLSLTVGGSMRSALGKALRQALTAQPLELQSGPGVRQWPLELLHASEIRSGGF